MSSDSGKSGKDRIVSEEDARRLLARAVELEAREFASIPLDELRIAAREAGIDGKAFDRALEELDSGLLRPPTVGRAISERLGRLRRAGYAGAFLGAAFATPGDSVLLSIVASFALCASYEGLVALARLFGGYSPPPMPPQSGTDDAKRARNTEEETRDPPDFQLLRVRGRPLTVLG